MPQTIQTNQARETFTNMFAAVYKEEYPVSSFMLSYFTEKYVPTLMVSTEVRRGTAKFAVDVERGDKANQNKFGLSTVDMVIPPYYYEGFTQNDLQLYNQVFGKFGVTSNTEIIKALNEEVQENTKAIMDKIARSYELNAIQVMTTGKLVTDKMPVGIDYKPKATHIKTLSTKWSASTPDIIGSLKTLATQLKKDGAAAISFDVIMGEAAAEKLLNSTEYLTKYALSPVTVDQALLPRAEKSGVVYHRSIGADSFIFNLYTYAEYLDDTSNAKISYFDPKLVLMVAKSFVGLQVYAAVPRTVPTDSNSNMSVLESGKFVTNSYFCNDSSQYKFNVRSAGIPKPVTIDHYGCMRVLD